MSREIITPELARYLTEISQEINRQIGRLINRSGSITPVIVGDAGIILIPALDDDPL